MKIYLAGSMKNVEAIRSIGNRLREHGISVYAFCDEHEYAFRHSVELRERWDTSKMSPKSIFSNPTLRMIGVLNLAQLEICDVCVIVLPSGRSAHLEGGFMHGRGRPLYIIGPMEPGEFDAMYLMANGIYELAEFDIMVKDIKGFEVKRFMNAKHKDKI